MSILSFLIFVRKQWKPTPPVRTADLTGKTVVVIGANTGIGFEAAKHFARMNPGKLILACRDEKKGTAALSKLRTETGCDSAEMWLIDLSKFSSVKSFADKFEKEGGRLDYLVLNAGMSIEVYQSTEDGWESNLQVNCLALSLLALLLLPAMLETARTHSVSPRMVVVSSTMHFRSTFDPQVLESQDPLRLLGSEEYCTNEKLERRYCDTKLINVFFARALSDRLRNTPIIVDVADPGLCASGLRRNIGGLRGVIMYLEDLLAAWTPEQGSRNLLFAALAGIDNKDEEENLRGAFITRFTTDQFSPFVRSEEGNELQERLWKETLDILGKVDSRVSAVTDKLLL